MRLVLDTNVLISAIGWKGNERAIVDICNAGKAQLLLSPSLVVELISVIKRPKFNRISSHGKLNSIKYLMEIATIIHPKMGLDLIEDNPSDNKVFECAAKGNADFIISGDVHVLSIKEWRKIKIMNASDFLKSNTFK